MAETPNIPPLSTKVDAETRRAFAALKAWFEKTGSLVTANDLISAGLAAHTPTGGLTTPGTQSNTTIPPALSGFTVTGAFATIILEWDDPEYAYFSHVEIWRAEVDDLGQAVKVATTEAMIYADLPPHASTTVTYYYWVRIVSTSNIAGPFNATEGTPGSTAGDPAYMLALLSGQISESQLATSLNTRLNGLEGSLADLLEGIPEGAELAASALAAAESAAAAAISESNAITAEANAIIAANAAAGDATAAGNSASAANTFASQASQSAGVAGSAATAATTARTAAEAANLAAGTAAQSAVEHSDSAASYATEAGAAATAASTWATQAATSESNASTYASQTSNSANNAATSASLAGTHAANSFASATTATAAASSATEASVEAAQSASTALSYVGEAGAIQVEQKVRATTVGPNYDATKSYADNKVVIYNNKIYQNNTGGTVGPETFNVAHWKEVTANLYGQYTVKLDINGYVSGFGMSNDGSSSTFLVNCDKFAIGKPGATTALPFIVSGGVVYMNSAMIQNATITNAKIANLAVDSAKLADLAVTNAKIAALAVTSAKIGDAAVTTLKIGEDQVTVPVGVYTDGAVTVSQGGVIQSGVIDSAGYPVIINFSASALYNSGATMQIAIYRGATLIFTSGVISNLPVCYTLTDTPPAGAQTYTVRLFTVSSGTFSKRSLVLLGAKR